MVGPFYNCSPVASEGVYMHVSVAPTSVDYTSESFQHGLESSYFKVGYKQEKVLTIGALRIGIGKEDLRPSKENTGPTVRSHIIGPLLKTIWSQAVRLETNSTGRWLLLSCSINP